MDQSQSKPEVIVSVCMITYNHEKYIAEAIEGVLMQKSTFSFELVIGEDCSTDKTRAICEIYQKKFPHIIKLLPKQEKNLGMMANLVITLKECKGTYIALCEGDDYWIKENKLQLQYEILEKNPSYSLVFSYQHRLIGKDLNKGENTMPGIKQTKDVLLGFIPPTRTVFFRNYDTTTDFLGKLGNQPSGDKFLAYHLSTYGDFYCLENHTAVYRVTGSGVWTSLTTYEQLLISFIHYFEFLKLIKISSLYLHLRRHYTFINNISDWLAPFQAQSIYFHSIKELYVNNLPMQALISTLLLFPFYSLLMVKILRNKWQAFLK